MRAVTYLHEVCHETCRKMAGKYLPVRGAVAIFSHYEDEFVFLTTLRRKLTDRQANYSEKYFKLHKPIIVPRRGDTPEAKYEFLYVRRPDAGFPHVGDVDFVMPESEHAELKKGLNAETFVNGMRLFHRPEENMIELRDANADVITYIATTYMLDIMNSGG